MKQVPAVQQARDLTPETIENPKTRRVLDYWLSKRAGREMPSRADIEPLELRDVLGNLCLADVTDETPPRFRYRVDGTNLAAMTGFDMTGKYAEQLPHAHYRDYVLALYARVVETRAPIIRANEEEWAGYGMRVESITLPLSSDGRRVDGILDAVFPYDR